MERANMADEEFERKKREFQCLKCGDCCTIPGEVSLTPEEGEKIARLLAMDLMEFKRKYMKKVWRQYVFNMPYKGGCIFLRDKKCTIYEARPEQCRTFPYWDELQASHENWKEIETFCQGAKKTKTSGK